jgi:hypothetical protein
VIADWFLWFGWKLLELVGTLILAIAMMAVVVAILLLCLIVIGKIMGYFYVELKDPELGTVKIGFGSCDGKIALDGKRRIPFTLPAQKKEMVSGAKDLLLRAKADWPLLSHRLLEHFADEIEEEGLPPDLIKREKWVLKLARERDLENLQRFTKLEQVEVKYGDKNGPIQLRISTLHRWDPEHERVLLLDDNLAFKFYGLGCQC